jgi:catechol 2,3-dioxygenase-like lactoylglutathione lyase family enzyme
MEVLIMQPEFAFALQYVSDIEASKAFYQGVMGLTVQRDHPVFVQFEHFAIASDDALGGGNIELYWLVDDVEAAHRELSAKTRTSDIRDMPFGRLFTVDDPAGTARFIIQLASQRPSQAV